MEAHDTREAHPVHEFGPQPLLAAFLASHLPQRWIEPWLVATTTTVVATPCCRCHAPALGAEEHGQKIYGWAAARRGRSNRRGLRSDHRSRCFRSAATTCSWSATAAKRGRSRPVAPPISWSGGRVARLTCLAAILVVTFHASGRFSIDSRPNCFGICNDHEGDQYSYHNSHFLSLLARQNQR